MLIGDKEVILEDARGIRHKDFSDLRITLSICGYYGKGVSDRMMQEADQLLYRAKVRRDCPDEEVAEAAVSEAREEPTGSKIDLNCADSCAER